ncbi:hypothetical protein [Schlesneria paludicola]|uniref:hypothetical protein n=1 Tax=Schlesneria paludicola TaxID=360056 RepID=UPI00192B6C4D|nr:hypothetical protein [Schlesneria paludicola]
MAMFAYFNACLLGIYLRDNIAHPWASVLPNYRKKHLLVTTLIALLFLGIPMFLMELVGASDVAPTSVAVIFLTCLAAGLWTPIVGVLAFPFLGFVMTPSSSFPQLADFLAGRTPVTSAALVFISLLALWAFAWRLLVLNEEMVEYAFSRLYGDLLRGRSEIFRGKTKTIADHLAALPANKRGVLQNFESFTNLKQIDNLSGYSERSLSERLQLWRLGTAPTRVFASVGGIILITFIFVAPIVLLQPLVGAELKARDPVVVFSVQIMTNPFNIYLYWYMRLHRLGYESLRPRTRPEFVRELGLAFLWDVIQCWLGGVLFMGIAAAIWVPEFLQVKKMLLFVLDTGVAQLCAYAMYAMMGTWLLKRGMMASVSWAFCPFIAMTIWMLFIVEPIGVELNIAIALVLATASVATIARAYRHWLRADLD